MLPRRVREAERRSGDRCTPVERRPHAAGGGFMNGGARLQPSSPSRAAVLHGLPSRASASTARPRKTPYELRSNVRGDREGHPDALSVEQLGPERSTLVRTIVAMFGAAAAVGRALAIVITIFEAGRALGYLVQLTAIEPHPSTLRAEVDFHSLPLAHHQVDLTPWTLHRLHPFAWPPPMLFRRLVLLHARGGSAGASSLLRRIHEARRQGRPADPRSSAGRPTPARTDAGWRPQRFTSSFSPAVEARREGPGAAVFDGS